jgi:hypothetical protein
MEHSISREAINGLDSEANRTQKKTITMVVYGRYILHIITLWMVKWNSRNFTSQKELNVWKLKGSTWTPSPWQDLQGHKILGAYKIMYDK